MAQAYYLDTSIWRDYYKNRVDNFRPLGEWAFRLLQKIFDKEELVLISDQIIRELNTHYPHEKTQEIFAIAQQANLLKKVEIRDEQTREAAQLSKERNVSFGDALHAILARDNQAIMIARDKHFLELIDITSPKKPEELI